MKALKNLNNYGLKEIFRKIGEVFFCGVVILIKAEEKNRNNIGIVSDLF